MRTTLAVLLLALAGCGEVAPVSEIEVLDVAPVADATADAPDASDDGPCRCVFRAHPQAGGFVCYTEGGTACAHVRCVPVQPVCPSSGCTLAPL